MNIILVARTALWLLFLLEALVLVGVVPVPSSALTWPWLVYLVGAYLLLLELPLFLTRDRPEQQRHFTLLAVAMVVNHVSDAPGQLLDLYRTTASYDKVLHATTLAFLIGAFCLGVALVLRDSYALDRVPAFVPCSIVLMGMFLSVTHEFIELTIDLTTASNAGTTTTDIHDTALDLVADLAGLMVFRRRLVGRATPLERRRRPVERAAGHRARLSCGVVQDHAKERCAAPLTSATRSGDAPDSPVY